MVTCDQKATSPASLPLGGLGHLTQRLAPGFYSWGPGFPSHRLLREGTAQMPQRLGCSPKCLAGWGRGFWGSRRVGAGCEEAGESGEQEDDSGRFLRQGGVGRKQWGDIETDTQTHTRRGRELRGRKLGGAGKRERLTQQDRNKGARPGEGPRRPPCVWQGWSSYREGRGGLTTKVIEKFLAQLPEASGRGPGSELNLNKPHHSHLLDFKINQTVCARR